MSATTNPAPVEGRRAGWLDQRLESAETGAGNRRWFGGLMAAVLTLAVSDGDLLDRRRQPVVAPLARSGRPGIRRLGHDARRRPRPVQPSPVGDLGASLKRVALGLLWGTLAGVPLGLLIGLSRWADPDRGSGRRLRQGPPAARVLPAAHPLVRHRGHLEGLAAVPGRGRAHRRSRPPPVCEASGTIA